MKNDKAQKMVEHQKQVKDDNTKRLLKVIREMRKNGEEVTVSSVANKANVTRQTIYRNETVKEEVYLLRGRPILPKTEPPKKSKSQAEIIRDLRNRNKELEDEKRLLMIQLAEKEEAKITKEIFGGNKA